MVVTPLVGVWIEIIVTACVNHICRSLPLWECGLKFLDKVVSLSKQSVTPLVGVWIEMI